MQYRWIFSFNAVWRHDTIADRHSFKSLYTPYVLTSYSNVLFLDCLGLSHVHVGMFSTLHNSQSLLFFIVCSQSLTKRRYYLDIALSPKYQSYSGVKTNCYRHGTVIIVVVYDVCDLRVYYSCNMVSFRELCMLCVAYASEILLTA